MTFCFHQRLQITQMSANLGERTAIEVLLFRLLVAKSDCDRSELQHRTNFIGPDLSKTQLVELSRHRRSDRLNAKFSEQIRHKSDLALAGGGLRA